MGGGVVGRLREGGGAGGEGEGHSFTEDKEKGSGEATSKNSVLTKGCFP